MYGILVLAIVTVFVAGLMVGRTPEYIGKKIRPVEMKYAALYFLTLPVLVLGASGLSIGLRIGQSAIFNPGPHGLTEVVYAFAWRPITTARPSRAWAPVWAGGIRRWAAS